MATRATTVKLEAIFREVASDLSSWLEFDEETGEVAGEVWVDVMALTVEVSTEVVVEEAEVTVEDDDDEVEVLLLLEEVEEEEEEEELAFPVWAVAP